jgi:hypothetical protein
MDEAKQIIEAMAVNEEKIKELYQKFIILFPGDAGLWSKLVEDENTHATLIRDFGKMLRDQDIRFNPSKFTLINLEKFRQFLENSIQESNAFNREKSLELAAQIERSLVEAGTFSVFETDVKDLKNLFTILETETQKHAKIISEYRDRI